MDESKVTLLSFCTLKHKDVWEKSSNFIPQHITANKFQLYVPDTQVDVFKAITNSYIEVKPESTLYGEFYSNLKIRTVAAGNEKRFNWYLQQFLKIQALIISNSDYLIIWDSDCIPLRKIKSFDNGLPLFMSSREFHKPYFILIEKVLGLKTNQSASFIGPSFPIPKTWVTEFISELETLHNGAKWYEILIENIDFSLESGFSEFETLGTWVSSRHPNEFKRVGHTWERYGQSKFGQIQNLNILKLEEIANKNNLDVITFENWDKKTITRLIKNEILQNLSGIKNLFTKFINKVNKISL